MQMWGIQRKPKQYQQSGYYFCLNRQLVQTVPKAALIRGFKSMKKLYFDLWSSKLSSSEFSCISLLGISKHCWDSVFRWYHSKLISCTQKSDQVRGKGMHWLPVMGKILGNTSPGSNVKLILNQTSLHFSESIFSKLRMNKIWERRESQLRGGRRQSCV